MCIYIFCILTRSSLRAVQSSPYQILCGEFSARGATSHKESRQPQGFYRLEVRKWPTYILLSSVWPVLCRLSLFTITVPPNRKPTPVSKATIDYILWAALSTRAIVTRSTPSGGVVTMPSTESRLSGGACACTKPHRPSCNSTMQIIYRPCLPPPPNSRRIVYSVCTFCTCLIHSTSVAILQNVEGYDTK